MDQQAGLKILLADGDSLFRVGAKALLASEPSLQLVAETQDGEQTIALVRRQRPDVLLLDEAIPGLGALEVLRRIEALHVTTKTVLVAGKLDRATVRLVLMRGVQGILRKDTATDLLIKCIHTVAGGELWIARDAVSHLVEALRHSPRDGRAALSPRDLDIVTALITGASNKTIATRLGVTEQTVKNRLRRIFAQLQVSNRVELALHAISHGLTRTG